MIKLITFLIIIINFVLLYKRNRVVSSSSIWLLCYFLIFIIYPTFSSLNFSNENLINYLALAGIIFYSMGIYLGNRIVFSKNKTKSEEKYLTPKFNLSFILYIVSFLLTILIFIKLYGINNIYLLLKGRITSKQLSLNINNSSVLILVQYIMIPCILCMWISSKSKTENVIRYVTLTLYLLLSFFISFTRIFMISIVIMIFFHEMLKKEKKQQVIYCFCFAIIITFLLIVLNFVRSLGLSYQLKLSTIFNLDIIFESTDFSFGYIMFDNLLTKPSPFINPVVYLKPFFVFIPRTIWENKPETLNVQVLEYLNPQKAATGYSTGFSLLGEGYALLGYIGCLLFPFIWGIICSSQDKKYYERINNNHKDSLKNIYYYIFSILIIISAQRGDWSVYLTIIIYSLYLPAFLLSKFSLKREKSQ